MTMKQVWKMGGGYRNVKLQVPFHIRDASLSSRKSTFFFFFPLLFFFIHIRECIALFRFWITYLLAMNDPLTSLSNVMVKARSNHSEEGMPSNSLAFCKRSPLSSSTETQLPSPPDASSIGWKFTFPKCNTVN